MTNKKYTNQSVFDLVCAHIFNQGERAIGEIGGCAYKSSKGTKCAVGALLTDKECAYLDLKSDGGIGVVMNNLPFEETPEARRICKKLGDVSTELLEGLQRTHDSGRNWDYTKDMREALRSVGFEHQLDVSCLEGMHFGDR